MDYIKKLLKLLNKRGKKTIAVKTVNLSLEKLRKKIPPSRLNLVFERIVPAVKTLKKKVAGKVYQIPAIINSSRAVFQTAKWVATAVEAEKKGKKLHQKLGKVILETAKNSGVVWKLKKEYQSLIKENRSYMRFIKKRRKKKRIWVFKQRFTTRITREEEKEKSREKKRELIRLKSNLILKRNEISKKTYRKDNKYRRTVQGNNNSTQKVKFNKKVI